MAFIALSDDEEGRARLSETRIRGPFSQEQRRDLRLVLEPGEAWLRTAGADEVELIDLSASGVAVALPAGVSHAFRELTGELKLGDRRAGVRLERVRLESAGTAVRVGARFRSLSEEAWGEIGNFLIGGFSKREKQLSRLNLDPTNALRFEGLSFLVRLLRRQTVGKTIPLHVYSGVSPEDVRLYAASIAWERTQPALVAFARGSDARQIRVGGEYSFLLPGKTAVSIFSSRILQVTNESVLIEIPQEIRQCGFRDSGRRKLSSGRTLWIRTFHPRSNGRIDGILSDVSLSGFSFTVTNSSDPMFPGDDLPEVGVRLPTEALTPSVVIRRVSRRDARSGFYYGVRITSFPSDHERERWERFVFEQLHPRLVSNEPQAVEGAWDLLGSSGYLDLWTPKARRRHLEDRFLESWVGIPSDQGHVTFLVSERKERLGTIAASRIYPRTWLVHSLGIDKDGQRRRRLFMDVARELYDVIFHLVQQSPNAAYFVLYVEKHRRWTKLLYGDFVDAYADDTASRFDEYRLFKRQTELAVPKVDRVAVRKLGGTGLQVLSREIRKAVSGIEFEAFSYDEDNFDLGNFRRAFPRAGTDRGRKAVAVYQEGVLVAALVAELGNEGTNVFGLLNQCRIVWCRTVLDRDRIKQTLLAEAVELYRAAGRKEFLFIDWDVPHDSCAAGLGYELGWEGLRWLGRTEIMPAWRSFVDEVLAQRVAGGNALTRPPPVLE